jgi:Peptidase family M23
LLALIGLMSGTAAAMPDPPRRNRVTIKPPETAGNQLVFPVLGRSQLTSSFGDPRGNGAHQGEDIMADKRTPAVAAEPGKVRFHTTSGRAGCMLYLYGRSGTTYLYVHLNNDLTEGNDNRGECVPGTAFWKGLRNGALVAAGQPIGFVGDSGDANGASPHLHFEVHPRGGRAVDPLPFLRSAKRLLFYAPKGSPVALSMSGKVVAVGGQSLRVRIATLRGPLGITLRNLGRPLTVSVPLTAVVERAAAGGGTTPVELKNAKPGETVGVRTEHAVATPAAQAGKDGALAAERVLLASA